MFFDGITCGKIKPRDEIEYRKLSNYKEKILNYDEPYNTIEMLSDKNWQEIVEESKEIIGILEKLDIE